MQQDLRPSAPPAPHPFLAARRRNRGVLIVTLVFAGLISLFFLFLYGTGPTDIPTWVMIWQFASCGAFIAIGLLFHRMAKWVMSTNGPALTLKRAKKFKTLAQIYFITMCIYSVFLLLATLLIVVVALAAAFLCFDTGRVCLAAARENAPPAPQEEIK